MHQRVYVWFVRGPESTPQESIDLREMSVTPQLSGCHFGLQILAKKTYDLQHFCKNVACGHIALTKFF